jgi:hypothetical protein
MGIELVNQLSFFLRRESPTLVRGIDLLNQLSFPRSPRCLRLAGAPQIFMTLLQSL